MTTSVEPQTATLDDLETVARIASAGFFDDPTSVWIFPDVDARMEQLQMMFFGLAADFLPDRGTVHILDNACISMWRAPGFDGGGGDEEMELPFPEESNERIGLLLEAMAEVHPHEPHWYLNFLITEPERQSQGLGSRTMEAVLRVCDADEVPAYLEATTRRNLALYERHGFVQTGEFTPSGGPPLYPMWRDPQS